MLKITFITILFAIIISVVKSFNNEYAVFLSIACGIFILFLSIEYITPIIEVINTISSLSILDSSLFKLIFKISSISLLVEFGASTVEEAGYKFLAQKLIFVGKVVLISTAIPMFYSFTTFLTEIF